MNKIFLYFSPRRAILRWVFLMFGIISILFPLFFVSKNHDFRWILLFDNSLSMSARDIEVPSGKISRLEAAKIFAKNLCEKISDPIAVASFARRSTLEMPFGTDKNLIKNVIDGMVPIRYGGGSNLADSLKTLSHIYAPSPEIRLIVFSDAEYFEGENFEKRFPNTDFIAMGSEKWAPIISEFLSDGTPIYREFDGEKVISRVDFSQSKKLFEALGASGYKFSWLSDQTAILEKILTKKSPFFPDISLFFSLFGVVMLFFSLWFTGYKKA